jgi:FkbM family methyltransferase
MIIDKINNFIEKGGKHFIDDLIKKCINIKDKLENKDILDIGSNLGFFSHTICDNMLYNSIHLFEPHPLYFNYSKKLLEKYNNITFNNFGVGNNYEDKILYADSKDNIGWNTFLTKDPNQNDNFIDYMDKYECKIIRLDDYYKDIKNIDFIKIDVEGYEALVIEGAFELIKKFKPYLYVEVGWGTNHPTWEYNYKIYKKLFEIGYKEVNFENITMDILFEPI